MTKPATILGAILALTALPARADTEIHVKNLNVAANPFGPFFSYYDGGVSLAVSQNVAISVSAASYSRDPQYDVHSGMTMTQIVASSPIYVREPFSGPFVEPGIIYRHGTQITSSFPHMVAGSSRWIGVERWDEPDINGYFRVGYAFSL